jgi:predicted RNase H-like HicB family nuclease
MLSPQPKAEECYTPGCEIDAFPPTKGEVDVMRSYKYTVILQPLPEGGYSVLVPAIPEVCTFGDTIEEARQMAEDAIRCFIESALKTGEYIPEDVEPALERVGVTLP